MKITKSQINQYKHKNKHMSKTEDEKNANIDDLEIEPAEKTKPKQKDKKNQEGLSDTQAKLILNLAKNLKQTAGKIISLLESDGLSESAQGEPSVYGGFENGAGLVSPPQDAADGSRIIEGVFDGENMIGPDGKQYTVPANYASKSKLVEGDILKLTITPTGTFVYKQIGPIERKRVVGILDQSSTGHYTVNSGDRTWRVLTASVTYFKGEDKDEVVILVPKTGESKWAAVENVVKNRQ